MIGVQITDDMNKKLKDISQKELCSISVIIRKALRDYINKYEQEYNNN